MTVDIAVIGGGPGGSICAGMLAARGFHVVLFERARHPRFHLGESLLPQSLDVLEAVGSLDEVRARFLVKRGARFVDAADETRAVRYAFADAFRAKWDHAFQVPRDEFDALLFRRAGELGAELREGCEVSAVVIDAGGRAVGVETRAEGAGVARISARFVVDATGRDALMARSLGTTERIPGLDRTALYTQVVGCWRDSGERQGDVQIVMFGTADDPGWLWFIPFADGRTSVGAVVSSAWVRARPAPRTPETLWASAIAQAPAAARMLASATLLFPARATADFSFRVPHIRGRGWICVGDAAGFIDPLFSTGAHLAMHGGRLAARAIDAALRGETADPFLEWEREMRSGSETFVGAVQAFYSGELTRLIFAEPQHPFLRRAITSMLSGDVFDGDKVWAREMRARFPARFSPAPA
jgi:flavin-dependent dehydrogenase